MTDEQKVLFKQLQLAGLGVVLILFGIFMKERNISFVGIGVMIYGILRYIFIKKILEKAE